MKVKFVCASKMFTRVPTFIPTSPVSKETRKVNIKARNGTVETSCITTQEPNTRRRKRTNTLRKRSQTRKSEDVGHVYDQLPLIYQNTSIDIPAPISETSTNLWELNGTGLNDSRTKSPLILSLHTTKTKERSNGKIKNDAKIVEQQEHLPGKNMYGTAREKINTDVTVSQESEMLTHPRLHKRIRRKFTEETHKIHTRSYANHDLKNVTNREVVRSVTISTKSKSATNRLDRLRRREIEGTKNFQSKIPVRFPAIQENKRYSSNESEKVSSNSVISLPSICDESYPKMADNSGQVRQSILNYKNKLEKDFQRLGENLENTFKMLNQYIERSTRSSSN